jgi:hypothetical protein
MGIYSVPQSPSSVLTNAKISLMEKKRENIKKRKDLTLKMIID